MTAGPLIDGMERGWAGALRPVRDRIDAMDRFLQAELAAGRPFAPARHDVLRAFRQPFADVRVVILGQDPYPIPGHATGLSFSVPASLMRVPSCLGNLFQEYRADLGRPAPATGDLSAWAQRGVLLLNTVLTVQENLPAAHRGKGWEAVTEQALRALVARDVPLVGILWGHQARDLGRLLAPVPLITSAHPSTMSATCGFFGSRPFSRANELLVRLGGPPVDWRL